MQKYKVVASKSQKKYTLIISADSELEAKEKLHSDGYSILSLHPVSGEDIEGKKFLFQIQKEDGSIKNGVIIGEDILKVYMKLTQDLGYTLVSLYPEGDEAEKNAEKKQKIMDDLKKGMELQKKKNKQKKQAEQGEESFYLQKKIQQTTKVIEKAIQKIEYILENRNSFEIDDSLYAKLEKIYEKILHIKGSTNIAKLEQVGELALVKVAQIELRSLESKKDQQSKKLLSETNSLLKQIGSSEHFVQKERDIKYIFKTFVEKARKQFSLEELSKKKKKTEDQKLIDKDSYGFLKTVLLLEKYKEKLSDNTKEIFSHSLLFLNIFSHSEKKDKILLKRKVIKQNISLLKAKKTGSVGSYTGIKKGFQKTQEIVAAFFAGIGNQIFFFCAAFYLVFFLFILLFSFGYIEITLKNSSIFTLILFQLIFILFLYNRGFFALFFNIVFLLFFYIFASINF